MADMIEAYTFRLAVGGGTIPLHIGDRIGSMSKIKALVLCVGLSGSLAPANGAFAEGTARHFHRHTPAHAPRQTAVGGGFYHSRQTYISPSVGVPPVGSTMPEAPVNTIPPGQPAAICGAGPYPACH